MNTFQTASLFAGFLVVVSSAWVCWELNDLWEDTFTIIWRTLGCLLLWPVFFPLYLRARPAYKAKFAAMTASARASAAAKAAAKTAAETHLVCPHCHARGTVTTGVLLSSNDRGATRTRECSTCQSSWPHFSPGQW